MDEYDVKEQDKVLSASVDIANKEVRAAIREMKKQQSTWSNWNDKLYAENVGR